MKKTINKFNSHQDATKADIASYKNMSMQQKIEELLVLLGSDHNETQQRLQRVYRIIELT